MRSTTVVLLHVLFSQAHAQDSMDKLMEQLADKLIERVSNMANDADLEKTTLAKAHPAAGHNSAINMATRGFTSGLSAPRLRTPVTSVTAMKNELTSYGCKIGPMEELALSAVAATRDVSAQAHMKQVYSTMDTKTQGQIKVLAEEVAEEAPKLSVTDLAGIGAPTGLFDPLGFASDCPAGTLLFYREAELKHGRVGMLASLGILVGESFHPLFGGNINVPAYKAFQETPLQTFWPAVLLAVGALEFGSILTFEQPFDKFSGYAIKKGWSIKDGRIPGDLGYDPLGLKPTDPKEFAEMQNKELNNGRLAMLATAGMLAQELVNGEKILR
eukprot:gnl/MRDRNA2_/MRDRNA2_90683_c0_seq1.p1 gnl/MRDRNA2_/MRDRNA2_90683_c0~~gnl/MRDRNA2_/MRDRNA2_90683_c0_seq1.p1  ORF type:complete len:329 (+),score=71.54 gnl/MRDRNA2_/MRDRNA2_90683_c0_seq1:78-1064(+)